MAYIYKITNKSNGKIYIGKTERTPELRFQEHCRAYKKEENKDRLLYRAMLKYGVDNFSFEVIEETLEPNEREQYWIEYYQSYQKGYNATRGGDGKSYIDYDLVVSTYKEIQNVTKVSELLNVDVGTIRKILTNYKIPILNSGEVLKKKVAKIDPNTGAIIKVYSSVGEAERENGNTHHIADVCNGKRKKCKDFFWKYI